MTNAEAIKTLKLMRAQVEWEYPMDYAAAIDEAISALELKISRRAVKDEKNGLVCPNCEKFAISGYCRYCGQLIDNLEEGKG